MPGFGDWVRGVFGGKKEQQPDASLPQATASTEAHAAGEPSGAFAGGHNEFALALYGRLGPERGNLFFSPLSVRTCLAMAYAGARGETAAQMGRALRLPAADDALHGAFAAVIQGLNAAGAGADDLTVANSVWVQDGSLPVAEYLDTITRHYGGGVNLVDFRRRTEVARAAINQWAEDTTRQRIRGLIPPGGVQADTRLVLANAAYFKGLWEQAFRRNFTRDEPFHLEDGSEARVPLMHLWGTVRYSDAFGCQAVDLDYGRGGLSMLILLPHRRNALRDLEVKLSGGRLRAFTSSMVMQGVEVLLPRFRIEWGAVDLGQPLRTLGMPLAFTPSQADFSGITGLEPSDADAVFLSAVYHKAFVDVNEEGTEAAAATATGAPIAAMRGSRPEPVPVFRADHPFIFAIRDRLSGVILFLGRVADPTRES